MTNQQIRSTKIKMANLHLQILSAKKANLASGLAFDFETPLISDLTKKLKAYRGALQLMRSHGIDITGCAEI